MVGSAQAADVTYVRGNSSSTGNCTDATTREDDSALAVENIDRVEYYIDNVDGNLASPLYTHIMPGGCAAAGAFTIDLAQFPSDITFYKYAITVDDQDPEKSSVASVSTSFMIVEPSAAPRPPTGIQ